MNDLSNNILAYYVKHFDELPFDKQFHFVSRLYLWNQSSYAQRKLADLRHQFTANDRPEEALKQVITAALESPSHGSKNAAELRRPYFLKYPNLKAYVSALFRVTFLEQIYGYNVRQEFFEQFPESEVAQFALDLLADSDAIAILSTHAVNFLYLSSRVLTNSPTLFDPAMFLKIGSQKYDLFNPLHLQLLIYLYTHCIIGESKFYYRVIPENPAYLEMLRQLETIIELHFEQINLDNKFEFLVCCRQLKYSTKLEDRIYEEAAQSISKNGEFLVDTLNNNPQSSNVTLDTSEHRNILFILSTTSYAPIS